MSDKTLKNAKMVTKFVVTRSVRVVIATAISNLVPTETKTEKVTVFIGTWALSGLVQENASAWAGRKFDDTIELFEQAKSIIKKTPAEQ